MVDAVLYFEGERIQSYRIIRAIKNRFGSTNEIGVFEMTDHGLSEVPSPSEMLLATSNALTALSNSITLPSFKVIFIILPPKKQNPYGNAVRTNISVFPPYLLP
jgi:hypothetical protein